MGRCHPLMGVVGRAIAGGAELVFGSKSQDMLRLTHAMGAVAGCRVPGLTCRDPLACIKTWR